MAWHTVHQLRLHCITTAYIHKCVTNMNKLNKQYISNSQCCFAVLCTPQILYICATACWTYSNQVDWLFHWVQWLRGRASDSRLWEENLCMPCCSVKTLGKFFYSTLLQFSCITEYLAIDSGGYVYKQHINCSTWLDASQRSRDGIWENRSIREVKCKALWAVLRTGYCAI